MLGSLKYSQQGILSDSLVTLSLLLSQNLKKGAPILGQLHSTDITTTTFADKLAPDFNNPKAWPDAKIISGGKEIGAHKHIVAKACPFLAMRWERCSTTDAPVVLVATNAIAVMFLKS